jgi:hypothetical protein
MLRIVTPIWLRLNRRFKKPSLLYRGKKSALFHLLHQEAPASISSSQVQSRELDPGGYTSRAARCKLSYTVCFTSNSGLVVLTGKRKIA